MDRKYINHIDSYHGHVIQGKSSIFQDHEITDILNLGTKFRLPLATTQLDIRNTLFKRFSEHIDTLQKKYKFDANKKTSIITSIQHKLDRLNIDIYNQSKLPSMSVLKQKIKQIQKDFVITPIDKANTNYSFTCKKMYVIFMNQELGYDWETESTRLSNETYTIYEAESESSIIERHNKSITNLIPFIKNRQTEHKIPTIYGIPKMHKNPIKLRFITGARLSSIKEISVEAKHILTHFKQHFKRYCRTIESRSFINLYWSIDSGYEILNTLKHTKTMKHVFTADCEPIH